MLFIRYAFIAASLAGISLAAMALIQRIDDSPAVFAISTAIVYGAGIVASYHLQARFTFCAEKTSKALVAFIVVSVLASIATTILATLAKVYIPWSGRLGLVASPVSFALGWIITGCATYTINRNVIFNGGKGKAYARSQ